MLHCTVTIIAAFTYLHFMKNLFAIVLLSTITWCNAQTKTIVLNDSIFTLQTNCYSPQKNNIYFINVHSNEITSKIATHQFLQNEGGCFIQLLNNEKRNISFNVKQKVFTIDPNRIFTSKGRKATLIKNSSFSKAAEKVAKKLADSILYSLVQPKLVVAMHNNTEAEYSINSYLQGGSEADNTEEVYINPNMDADDFVYTTIPKIFQFFKEKQINVILQKQKGFVNDGSLSAYCTFKKIDYLNVEAQAGHTTEQLQMLTVVKEIINWYK